MNTNVVIVLVMLTHVTMFSVYKITVKQQDEHTQMN